VGDVRLRTLPRLLEIAGGFLWMPKSRRETLLKTIAADLQVPLEKAILNLILNLNCFFGLQMDTERYAQIPATDILSF
jgi:hypothetical protein